MSLGQCIPDLVAEGKIPAKRAREISAAYERHLADFLDQGMDRTVAEAQATSLTLKLLERDALRRKRNALTMVKKQAEWLADMRARAGEGNPLKPSDATNKLAALDKKIDALRGRYFATLDKLLADHRRNVVGQVRNKQDLMNVGRELFGEKTGDLNARELADAISTTFEIARRRFNQAGGDIGKLDSYGLPQRHDSRAIRAAGFKTWRAHPSIDRVRIRDLDTGDFAIGAKRETLLRDIYETLRTEGANKSDPGRSFMGAMANRRGDPRILHFENFDDWISYQRDFGGGEDIYDTIASHLGMMARDTAIMEAMGPNPAATLRFQQDWLEKSAKIDGTQSMIDKLVGKIDNLQDIYDELTGANKIPSNRSLALGFSALRAVQVASKMGSAVASVGPDFGTLMYQANASGLPVMRVLSRYVKLWTPGAAAERQMAVRLGLVTDDWIGLSSSTARYTGEELAGEMSRRLADFVVRSQGLARHTRNGQWAFGMEYLGHLTEMRDRSFGNLDPAIQRQMQRYDIGEADWDAYRATPLRQERGTDWIFPTDNEKVGDRFLEMVLAETDYAVMTGDVRTRALIGSSRPGSFLGEIAKSAFLFKSFPLSILNLHGRRMLEQSTLPGMLRYSVPLLLLMFAGGGLSLQIKTILAGKDPRPINDPRFFAAGVAQSGGFGLFGDLLYNSENSFGGGPLNTLAGPILGQTIPNVADATVGNIGRALDGDEATKAEFLKDIANTIEKEIPGRNLWYVRLAWERIIADEIKRQTDPDFERKFADMIRRAEKEGTQYWLPPGETAGEARAPDLGNMLAEPPPEPVE
jgi:hypothetical protein